MDPDSNKLFGTPTDAELHERLQKLRGINIQKNEHTLDNKFIHFPNVKSNVEQVDDLMEQFANEVKIDSNLDQKNTESVEEIEKRLRLLQSETISLNIPKPNLHVERPSHSNETKNLFKKILAEAELEKKLELQFPSIATSAKKKSEDTNETEQFCTICVRPPDWVCLDCEMIYFCNRCNLEFHQDMAEPHRKKRITIAKTNSLYDSDSSD